MGQVQPMMVPSPVTRGDLCPPSPASQRDRLGRTCADHSIPGQPRSSLNYRSESWT